MGVVFKVSSSGKESVLYSFTGGADEGFPVAGLIQDKAGNFYGTTFRKPSYHLWNSVQAYALIRTRPSCPVHADVLGSRVRVCRAIGLHHATD